MPAQRSTRLADARRRARMLEREDMTWTRPLAAIVGACVANASGRPEQAATLLRAAVQSAETADMPLHAAAARHRLGLLAGGDAGYELVVGASAEMEARGVHVPARFAEIFVPDRWERT